MEFGLLRKVQIRIWVAMQGMDSNLSCYAWIHGIAYMCMESGLLCKAWTDMQYGFPQLLGKPGI